MVKQPPMIAASMLSADFARLGEEAAAALNAGADALHLDVMDNHYVPNLTFGAAACAALRRALPGAKMEAHLMASPADGLIAPFAAAGADALIFHPDASLHPHRTLRSIAAAGMRAGIALNPGTPPSQLEYLLDDADIVLLMTVDPGFGGQEFIARMTDKIAAAREIVDRGGRGIRVQVDGGINARTAKLCVAAGADTLVAGSAIFGGGDYARAVAALRGE